jgi:hypothetical protein
VTVVAALVVLLCQGQEKIPEEGHQNSH